MLSINGNNNVVKISFPTQQQLNLETKETFGCRIEPSVIDIIKQRAETRGTTASKYAGAIIKKYLQFEPHLKNLQSMIDNILD